MENSWTSWLFLIALAVVALLFWPKTGLFVAISRWRELRRRERFEDALKHILAWEQRRQDATPESIGGALGLVQSSALSLVADMEERDLIHSTGGALKLTAEGQRLALHVVRAHRLWERYLADDAGVPMERLHRAAEKAEHQLSSERIDALDAHLGHPERDPHGDPIPRADGSLEKDNAVPLTDWPVADIAWVTHIEDEPDVIFHHILSTGLRPGKSVRVIENTPECLVIDDGVQEHRLVPVVAANIQVAAEPVNTERPVGLRSLSELAKGEAAEVVELGSMCRGFSRRRLLDLGITPGTRKEASLDNPFGDPRAFRLRGTVIALRKAQGDQIWVRSIGEKTTTKDLSASDCYTNPEEIKRTAENAAQGISEA